MAKATVSICNEREKTRKFFALVGKRRREAREKPEKLIPLESINERQTISTEL